MAAMTVGKIYIFKYCSELEVFPLYSLTSEIIAVDTKIAAIPRIRAAIYDFLQISK